MVVWEGFLTKLFEQLGLSVPYYTKVTQALKRMGCIRQLRRGGGNAPSQWEVLGPPTAEMFRQAVPSKRRRSRTELLEEQVKDLTVQLLATKQTVEHMIGAGTTPEEKRSA